MVSASRTANAKAGSDRPLPQVNLQGFVQSLMVISFVGIRRVKFAVRAQSTLHHGRAGLPAEAHNAQPPTVCRESPLATSAEGTAQTTRFVACRAHSV